MLHGRKYQLRSQSGTASIEAALCLPFLFLILALTLELGRGWAVRLQAEHAARFAATIVRSEPATRQLVQQFFFPERRANEIGIHLIGDAVSLKELWEWRKAGKWSWGPTNFFNQVGRQASGRHAVKIWLSVRPVTGVLQSATVEAYIAADEGTWTHDVRPMSFDVLTDGLKDNKMPGVIRPFLKKVGQGMEAFLKLLGMEA